MAFFQFTGQVFNAVSLVSEQYNQVVQQVGSLVNQPFVGTVAGLDDRFHSFFAHFLRHLVDARIEQAGRVGFIRHLLAAAVDEILQLFQEHDVLLVLFTPASVGACVADRAVRMYHDEQGVVVAVRFDGYHVQEVAALFALGPQTVFRTAEKVTFPVSTVFS